MEYLPGDNAIAYRSGSGWALQPICDIDPFTNAVAVRAGGDWILNPAHLPESGENAIAVRTGGEWIITSAGCPDDDGGGGEDPPCTGQDPLCTDCPCEAGLASTYYVSISGFPAICDVDVFNGVWALPWTIACTWQVQIDPWRMVSLQMSAGYAWTVYWDVAAPGGASGGFFGTGPNPCAPETLSYAQTTCFNPFGCWGLCTGTAGGSVVVSR